MQLHNKKGTNLDGVSGGLRDMISDNQKRHWAVARQGFSTFLLINYGMMVLTGVKMGFQTRHSLDCFTSGVVSHSVFGMYVV